MACSLFENYSNLVCFCNVENCQACTYLEYHEQLVLSLREERVRFTMFFSWQLEIVIICLTNLRPKVGSFYPPPPPLSYSALFYRYLKLRKVTRKGKKSQQGLRPHLGIDLSTSLTSGGTPLYK